MAATVEKDKHDTPKTSNRPFGAEKHDAEMSIDNTCGSFPGVFYKTKVDSNAYEISKQEISIFKETTAGDNEALHILPGYILL